MIAYYPLETDLNDATGLNPPMQADNAQLQPAGGIYCNGAPTYASNPCYVRTPGLAGFDFSAFTVSAQFMVLELWGTYNPVFVGGENYRWLFYDLWPDGRVEMGINNDQNLDCPITYQIGVWHQAAITFDGQTAALYLDGTPGCSAPAVFETGGEAYFLLSNYSDGTTFRGLFRELKVYDRVVVPPPTTPQAASVTIPAQAGQAPVDRILAGCPGADELDAIDVDLQIRFETDPVQDRLPGLLACTAAQGSRDLSPFQKRVYNSLVIMKQIQFDQPLPWTTLSLYDWFIQQVDGIRLRGDISLSSCCDPARFINIAARNLTIVYTDRWIEPALGGGVDGFMTLLVHEARHAQGYPHTCGSDDNTLSEMGAWGIQYTLETWLADHGDPAFFAAPDLDYRQVELDNARSVLHHNFCLNPTPVP